MDTGLEDYTSVPSQPSTANKIVKARLICSFFFIYECIVAFNETIAHKMK